MPDAKNSCKASAKSQLSGCYLQLPGVPVMRQVITAAAAFVSGAGFATAIATDLRPDAKALALEVTRSLVSGIILASGVEPYQSKLAPDLIEWRVAASGYASAPIVSVADE
jgi:hypothetical protein